MQLTLSILCFCGVCSILSAPTADDQKIAKDTSSEGVTAKLRRLSRAANQLFGDMIPTPTPRAKSRIASIKSSFFLNEEAIKLPTSVVKSYALALAAMRSVAAMDLNNESSDREEGNNDIKIQEDVKASKLDPEGPMFRPHILLHRDPTQCNIEQFMKDLATQREAIRNQTDRDRFDLFWG